MQMLRPILFGVTVYTLFSALVVLVVKQIKWSWLRASLITLYFTTTVFVFVLTVGVLFAFLAGNRAEYLRQSSVDTAESVRILTLLRKSDAARVDPMLYSWVAHNLENKIDWLLPIADDYLSNRQSPMWKLHNLLRGDMTGTFERDLPLVVAYRKSHPPVSNHGSYDLLMRRYMNPKWKSWPYTLEGLLTNAAPASAREKPGNN
jgi:hypothetical protein